MYLSEWRIPWSWDKNLYELHRILWKAFPGRPAEQRSFVFRWERRQRALSVMMLSTVAPEMFQGMTCVRSSSFVPNLSQGTYGFILRANPIKRLSKARNRVPLVGEEALKGWLLRKTENACQMKDIRIQGRDTVYFRKGAVPGKLVTVDYEGVFHLKDKAALLKLMTHGIGPAKAFGCGMFLIRRV